MGDARVDALYGVPPGQFVEQRDALARALKAEGKGEEAKAVARLRRPAVAAWAIDQVARERRADVEALLRADDRLRASQAGAADPLELRAALQEQRERLRAVVRAAEEKLQAAARSAQARAIQATLLAAAGGGKEMRERLLRGTLDEELEAPGFDALSAAAPAGAARPPTAVERAVQRVERQGLRKARAAREAARRTARARERAARKQETKAEVAARIAAKAAQAATQARDAAERAAERAAAAQEVASQARAAASEARRRADEARALVPQNV